MSPVLRCRRPGFALLAVLWILTAAAALSFTLSLVAREAIATGRNRMDLTRAAWQAEGCLETTRAAIDGALHAPRAAQSGFTWLLLDVLLVDAGGNDERCDLTLVPAGATLDANSATTEQLRSLFQAMGRTPASSDSMAAAVLDWRDEDEVTREAGAEFDWYRAAGKVPPRNGPFASRRELRRVRGLEMLDAVDDVLGVEEGRVSLQYAPSQVLMALPGASEELVFRIMESRRNGRIINLPELLESVSASARAAVNSRYTEFVRSATTDPDAWILTSRSHIGSPSITAVIEMRFERAGRRAAVVRRRSWIE